MHYSALANSSALGRAQIKKICSTYLADFLISCINFS